MYAWPLFFWFGCLNDLAWMCLLQCIVATTIRGQLRNVKLLRCLLQVLAHACFVKTYMISPVNIDVIIVDIELLNIPFQLHPCWRFGAVMIVFKFSPENSKLCKWDTMSWWKYGFVLKYTLHTIQNNETYILGRATIHILIHDIVTLWIRHKN